MVRRTTQVAGNPDECGIGSGANLDAAAQLDECGQSIVTGTMR